MGLHKDDLDREIKYLNEKEVNKIFKIIANLGNKYWLRDLVLFRVGFETGCRASEMGLFRVSDFNKNNRDIYCRRIKNGNNNTIRLSKTTANTLAKYIKEYKLSEDDYLFLSQFRKPISRQTIDLLTKLYFGAAKIKDKSKYHFHTLRHTRAVTMLEQGFSLEDVQYVLGHKNIANTQIYAQFSSNYKKGLFDRMDKIGGIN